MHEERSRELMIDYIFQTGRSLKPLGFLIYIIFLNNKSRNIETTITNSGQEEPDYKD